MLGTFSSYIIIGLVIIAITLFMAIIYLFRELRESRNRIETIIKDYEGHSQDIRVKHLHDIEKARRQSVEASRRTIKGQIAQQIAPLLEGFPYLPSDSHFLGDPVDYIVFSGYTDLKEKHAISKSLEIVFIDIKHGRASLSESQKSIASAIEAGKVRFEVVRILDDGVVKIYPENPSKKKDETPLSNQALSAPSLTENSSSNIKLQSTENVNSAFKNWHAFLQKFPKAYDPWSESDDKLLIDNYKAGVTVNELALLLKRNPGKIRSRLKEKGLIKKSKSRIRKK